MSTLSEAKAKLDEFLKDNPKAQEYQKEIDEILAKVPAESRLEAIQMLMAGKLSQLTDAMSALAALGPDIK